MARTINLLKRNGFTTTQYSDITGGFVFEKDNQKYLIQGIFNGDKIIGKEIRHFYSWRVICRAYTERELIEQIKSKILKE